MRTLGRNADDLADLSPRGALVSDTNPSNKRLIAIGVSWKLLSQLVEATAQFGSSTQRDILDELVDQERLFDIERLALVLAD
jgi:hypothetical protein